MELTTSEIVWMAQQIDPTLDEDSLTVRSQWVTLGDRIVAEALNVLLSEGRFIDEEAGSITQAPFVYFARMGRFIYIEDEYGFMTYTEHKTTNAAMKHFGELEEMAK